MIKIGDLVVDNYGRKGIVVGQAEYPSQNWLAQQEDMRMRELSKNVYKEQWLDILPLDGGGIVAPKSLCKRVRKANKKDLETTYENANYFGKRLLDLLM